MPSAILEIKDVSIDLIRRGESRPVLRNISMELSERQALGVIGESGSGKTVLARLAIGAANPPLVVRQGEVLYRGRDLLKLDRTEIQRLRGREFGYIGNNPGTVLDPTIPVGEQIVEKLSAVEPGISRADAVRRTVELFEAVRLPSPKARFHEFPFQYSGGMMQRALIVDALITNPAFLIADNVTQPLDVTVAAQIIRLMQDLREQFSTAIIFVSNSLSVVREFADEVIVLSAGEIVERNRPGQLIEAPAHRYSKQLIERIPRIWATSVSPPQAPPGAKPMLKVNDVYKTYRVPDPNTFFGHNNIEAVRGVSFEVMAGENFGIVGESGCGKSTLSRLLSWVEEPDRGKIFFDGVDISGMGRRELLDLRRRFQLLLQDPYNAMPPHMPVGRTIAEPLRIHGLGSRKEVREHVLAIMNEVGMPPSLYESFLFGLSAGQLQRVNLARALVLKPHLLILDETLSALDQVEQWRLLELFERLQGNYGFTYIFISHDLAMVRRACSRIAVMYLGRIVEIADNETVFFNPGHPYTRALLSAVPTIEQRRYDPRECLLEGEPPSPMNIPPGCSFRPRCPLAFDRCAREDPPLFDRAAGGRSACFLANSSQSDLSAARMAPSMPDASGLLEIGGRG
jgi:peptide/nickel transport system ATP-binding protein